MRKQNHDRTTQEMMEGEGEGTSSSACPWPPWDRPGPAAVSASSVGARRRRCRLQKPGCAPLRTPSAFAWTLHILLVLLLALRASGDHGTTSNVSESPSGGPSASSLVAECISVPLALVVCFVLRYSLRELLAYTADRRAGQKHSLPGDGGMGPTGNGSSPDQNAAPDADGHTLRTGTVIAGKPSLMMTAAGATVPALSPQVMVEMVSPPPLTVAISAPESNRPSRLGSRSGLLKSPSRSRRVAPSDLLVYEPSVSRGPQQPPLASPLMLPLPLQAPLSPGSTRSPVEQVEPLARYKYVGTSVSPSPPPQSSPSASAPAASTGDRHVAALATLQSLTPSRKYITSRKYVSLRHGAANGTGPSNAAPSGALSLPSSAPATSLVHSAPRTSRTFAPSAYRPSRGVSGGGGGGGVVSVRSVQVRGSVLGVATRNNGGQASVLSRLDDVDGEELQADGEQEQDPAADTEAAIAQQEEDDAAQAAKEAAARAQLPVRLLRRRLGVLLRACFAMSAFFATLACAAVSVCNLLQVVPLSDSESGMHVAGELESSPSEAACVTFAKMAGGGYVMTKMSAYLFFFVKQRLVRVRPGAAGAAAAVVAVGGSVDGSISPPMGLWPALRSVVCPRAMGRMEIASLVLTLLILPFACVVMWRLTGGANADDWTCELWMPLYLNCIMIAADAVLSLIFLYLFVMPLRDIVRLNREARARMAAGFGGNGAGSATSHTLEQVMRLNTRTCAYSIASTSVAMTYMIAANALLSRAPSLSKHIGTVGAGDLAFTCLCICVLMSKTASISQKAQQHHQGKSADMMHMVPITAGAAATNEGEKVLTAPHDHRDPQSMPGAARKQWMQARAGAASVGGAWGAPASFPLDKSPLPAGVRAIGEGGGGASRPVSARRHHRPSRNTAAPAATSSPGSKNKRFGSSAALVSSGSKNLQSVQGVAGTTSPHRGLSLSPPAPRSRQITGNNAVAAGGESTDDAVLRRSGSDAASSVSPVQYALRVEMSTTEAMSARGGGSGGVAPSSGGGNSDGSDAESARSPSLPHTAQGSIDGLPATLQLELAEAARANSNASPVIVLRTSRATFDGVLRLSSELRGGATLSVVSGSGGGGARGGSARTSPSVSPQPSPRQSPNRPPFSTAGNVLPGSFALASSSPLAASRRITGVPSGMHALQRPQPVHSIGMPGATGSSARRSPAPLQSFANNSAAFPSAEDLPLFLDEMVSPLSAGSSGAASNTVVASSSLGLHAVPSPGPLSPYSSTTLGTSLSSARASGGALTSSSSSSSSSSRRSGHASTSPVSHVSTLSTSTPNHSARAVQVAAPLHRFPKFAAAAVVAPVPLPPPRTGSSDSLLPVASADGAPVASDSSDADIAACSTLAAN